MVNLAEWEVSIPAVQGSLARLGVDNLRPTDQIRSIYPNHPALSSFTICSNCMAHLVVL